MPGLDLEARDLDRQTAAEKVALRVETTEGFATAFDRLVQSNWTKSSKLAVGRSPPLVPYRAGIASRDELV